MIRIAEEYRRIRICLIYESLEEIGVKVFYVDSGDRSIHSPGKIRKIGVIPALRARDRFIILDAALSPHKDNIPPELAKSLS